MAVRTSLNVSLTPELGRFVQARVATGRYQTASEVIREGLRLLEHQERDHEANFQALKAKLARGSAEADRGKFVEAKDVLADIRRLKRKRMATKKP